MAESKDIQAKEVIEFLFTRQRQTYLAFATGLVRDAAVAEDIVSEAIASVWEHREGVRDMNAYLLTSIKNGCARHLRDSAIRRTEPMGDATADFDEFYAGTIETTSISEVYEQEIFNILLDTLSTMPETARSIFQMKKMDGRSYKEISAALGVTHAQIDHTLRRVMKALTAALSDYGPQIAIIAAGMGTLAQ